MNIRAKIKNYVNIPDYASVLKQLRVVRRLTQKQVAKKIGVSAMGLSFFENGHRTPNIKVFEKWLEVLGLKLFIDNE